MAKDSSKDSMPPITSDSALSKPRLLIVRISPNNDVASERGLPEAYEKLANRGYNMDVVQPWTITPALDEASAIRTMIGSIREQVTRGGSFSELRFTGHGNTDLIVAGNVPVNVQNLLKALDTLQQELKQPIAQKIIFDACSVFKELKPEQVASFRELSVKLNAEIVGNIHYALSDLSANDRISFKKGQVGYFTPSDKEDSLKTDVFPAIRAGMTLYNRGRFTPNNAWIECHTDRTQKTGELCQKVREPIEEVTGFSPLAIIARLAAPLVQSAFDDGDDISPKAIAKVQKLLMNDGEREQLRLFARYPNTKASEPSSPIILPITPKEMSHRADAILSNSGLLEKDPKAAQYLRDPESRYAYLKMMRDTLRAEKDPNMREAINRMMLAATDFVKIDRLASALVKNEQDKLKTEIHNQYLQETLPQPSWLKPFIKSPQKPGGRE